MDEMDRFLAVQAIEADLMHRRERLTAGREAARQAAYAAYVDRAGRAARAPDRERRRPRGPFAALARRRAAGPVARPAQ